jgi:ribosomal protein L2
MIIRSYRQALGVARSAGEDAANRRMRKAGRRRWTLADYDHAVSVMNRVLDQLGYGPAPGMNAIKLAA